MKEFDSVKWILNFAVVATIALAGGYLWLGRNVAEEEQNLKSAKQALKAIGVAQDGLDLLKKEQEKDSLGKKGTGEDAVGAYLQEMAAKAGLRIESFNPRDKENGPGFVDSRFSVDFKTEHSRQNLMAFLYRVEFSSPRIKLVECNLSLKPELAEGNKWKGTFQFVKRDPVR